MTLFVRKSHLFTTIFFSLRETGQNTASATLPLPRQISETVRFFFVQSFLLCFITLALGLKEAKDVAIF